MANETEDQQIAKEAVHTVPVEISVVLGKANLRVNQLLKLGRGAVVELEQKINEPIEVFANGILIAKGDINIIDGDKIGVVFTEIIRSLNT